MALTSYTIERHYSVDPERLFRAFTDPEELKAWVWGKDAQGVEAAVDLRIGGTLEMSIPMPGGEERAGFRCLIVEVESGRRLVHTVHWDADVGYNAPGMNPVDEVLATDFTPADGGTLLRYAHLGIPDDGVSAPEHERSVRATLDDLETHLCPGE